VRRPLTPQAAPELVHEGNRVAENAHDVPRWLHYVLPYH
jgi:hypothetical protein